MDDETQAKLIRDQCHSGDLEADHCNADDILIAVLRELGFNKTADAWDDVGKWYA